MATPGSIAEYDMILSISQDAINGQLEDMYEIRLRPEALAPPTPVKGFSIKTTPAATHVISHDLWVVPDDDDASALENNATAGLRLHIGPPRISFEPDKTIRVSLKCRRDQHHRSEPNSTIRWWSDEHKSELKEAVINGWKFSWEVKLGQKQYENVIADLLNPSNDPNHHIALPPAVYNKLSTIDNRVFLPSTIFCLSEAKALFSSIIFIDPSGNQGRPPGVNDSVIHDLDQYFTSLPSDPSPYNPFILGYGVTQKLQPLHAVDPNLRQDLKPAYLVPKSFDFSTTPYPGDYRLNTLNYCMLTHRSYNDGEDRDQMRRGTDGIDHPPGAGILQRNLFDVTRSKEHGGVLGICSDIFLKRYIADTVNKAFFVEIGPCVDQVARTMVGENVGRSESTTNLSIQGLTVERTSSAHSDRRWWPIRNPVVYLSIGEHKKLRVFSRGISKCTTTLSSDASGWGDQGPADPTWERRIFARTEIEYNCTAVMQISDENTDLQLPDDNIEHFKPVQQADLKCRYFINLVIKAGAGGTWSVEKSDSHLPESGGPIDAFPGFPGPMVRDLQLDLAWARGLLPNQYGTFFSQEAPPDGPKWFNYEQAVSFPILASIFVWGPETIKTLLNAMQNLFSTSNIMVMSPAGEAFTFNGMDTDAEGNAYTHVTYAVGDAHRSDENKPLDPNENKPFDPNKNNSIDPNDLISRGPVVWHGDEERLEDWVARIS